MSLRTRLTLIAAGSVVAVVVLVSLAAFASTVSEVERQADLFLTERAEQLSRVRDRPPRGGDGFFGFNESTPVQFITLEGLVVQTIGSDDPLPVSQADTAAIAEGKRSAPHTVTVDGRAFRVITVPIDADLGLMLGQDLAEQAAIFSGLSVRLPIIGLAAAVVAGMVAWAAVGRAVRPLDTLTQAAERVAATQELAIDFPPSGEGEIGRLSKSFQSMLQALSVSKQQQRRLVDDASHELRTPLTSLRNNIGYLKRADSLEVEKRTEVLDDIEFELEELSDLVSELVELATDSGAATEPTVKIPMDTLVEAVVHRARRRSGREISVQTASIVVPGSEGLMERAISNLISNAIKFSPSGTPVDVVLEKGRISVRDYGEGIRDEDKEHIFERFYRSEAARTMPGSGLGLSIVNMAAERHEGVVFVSDADPGTIIGFSFGD